MFAGKPIIGIVGGIGSGKSHVAGLFGQMGCLVIDSDRQVSELYTQDEIKRQLVEWWGPEVLDARGNVDRRAIAHRVFADPAERRRLEGLIHPLVGRMRDEQMKRAADDPGIVAYVWDTPLLIEAGLDRECDALVFVEAPEKVRSERVARSRNWSVEEWLRREKWQTPLDKKRRMAKYMVRNTADADDEVRNQVRDVLSRILADVRRLTSR